MTIADLAPALAEQLFDVANAKCAADVQADSPGGGFCIGGTTMKNSLRIAPTVFAVALAGMGLSGCIIAAVPLIMAAGAVGVAAAGFVVYKTVQTTGGGTVRIAFGSNDPKKASPPQPLPAFSTVAVWSGGAREQKLVSTLQLNGKFRVVSTEAGALPATVEQRKRAYEAVCQRQRVNLVLSGVDDGETISSNMLSFKRGAVTHKITLEGYGCAEHNLVWGDAMAVIIESGHQATPQSEIDGVAGQAWAERILQARAA